MKSQRIPADDWAKMRSLEIEVRADSAIDVCGYGFTSCKMYPNPDKDTLPANILDAIKRDESYTY